MDGTSNAGQDRFDPVADLVPQRKVERLALLKGAFRERFSRMAEGVAEAPGRVNLIGEHLDYNEGLVLPVAIDRSVLAAFARRSDAEVRLYSLDFGEESSFSLDGPTGRDEACSWSNYLRGVVWALRREGCSGPGLEMAVTGDVPMGSGLASSAALEVAGLGALRAAWEIDIDDKRLARTAQRAENEFVGVQCGIMDQFASAMGWPDHALLIDCRSLQHEAVPLGLAEAKVAIVVVDSSVPRRLERSEYNRRREECAEALGLLRTAVAGKRPEALGDVSPASLEDLGSRLPPRLLRRARHVVSEMERVRAGVGALRRGDLEAFGRLMSASHVSLRDDFEVSGAELDLLVEVAQGVSGALGARLTGAGFGGCTVNLVRTEALASFRKTVLEGYAKSTGLTGSIYVCRPSAGLRLWAAEGG